MAVSTRDNFLKNPWWGKIICAACGYLIFGAVGAVFGLIVGNMFDKGAAMHLANPLIRHYLRECHEIRKIYYTSLFRTLGHLAKSDGKVIKAEIMYAKFMMSQLNLHGRERIIAQDFFNQGKRSNFNLQKVLTLLLNTCHHNPDLLELFAQTCLQMAKIHDLTQQKQQAINLIFIRLGFKPVFRIAYSERQERRYKNHYSAPSSSYAEGPSDFDILGIKSNCTKSELKKAYRKMIGRFHPDRLIAQGKSEREIKEATQRSQQIQAAYERLKETL